jgi:hypothetical protein
MAAHIRMTMIRKCVLVMNSVCKLELLVLHMRRSPMLTVPTPDGNSCARNGLPQQVHKSITCISAAAAACTAELSR